MATVFANAQVLQDSTTPQSSSPGSPTATFQFPALPVSVPSISVNGTNRPETSQAGTLPQNSISLDPPPGMAYRDFLHTWSDDHVSRWLMDIKCGHHAATFRDNDIRGDVLLELEQTTLKEMGLASVGDRVRVLSGVKTLRQKCSSSAPNSLMNQSHMSGHNRNGSLNGITSRSGARRLDTSRPPPLHLTPGVGSDGLPRIIRDGQSSAASITPPTIRPLPQPHHSSSPPTHTPNPRPTLPPLPPPPRVQPPQPPNARMPRSLQAPPFPVTGRRTPTQPDGAAFTSQPLPPAPGLLTPIDSRNNASRLPLRSPSPLSATPGQQPRTPAPSSNANHGRNASLGSSTPVQSTTPTIKLPPRPSTGPTPHPYASHAPAIQTNLSPIHENFTSQRGASTPSPPSANPYRVGGGPFLRPTTPSHNPSLDDLRRKLIRFALPDEGKSTMLNVADCAGGAEVLERALKKFGKLRVGDENLMNIEIIEGGLSVDGWGVYLEWGQDDTSGGGPLSEAQLLSICHAPPDEPAREHGLTLRQIGRNKRSRNRSPSSPQSAKPSSSAENLEDTLLSPDPAQTPATKAMKRASSVSILSGLGVRIPDGPDATSPSNESPTKTPSLKRGPSKLRNFFGQRPPSELITTHLAEYFPFTEKKVLERTRRQSMMRGAGSAPAGRRDSIISWNPPSRSRFSVSTQGSHLTDSSSVRNSMSSAMMFPERAPSPTPSEAPPRLSISTDDGTAIDISGDESEEAAPAEPWRLPSTPHLLPPVAFPTESLSESLNLKERPAGPRPVSRSPSPSSNRMSMITELRSKRDRSDTWSLLTVDEITAEVESRQDVGSGSTEGTDEWTKVDVDDSDKMSVKQVEDEDVDDDEDDDESENEGSDATVTDDDEGEPGKAIMSHGEKTIKWIKGALIGAGSFGKVYLGMDASTGLLMAVKQVELPTGSAPNEERKKSMLSALEREIELLKDLHHENIVQYHSSCIDDDHLNIFLEYVPGGSVTSLLRNYGAFEEGLVRNWVRQILSGLDYLHERDIIHRDIKGANMLVDNKGGIKISDFGISKKVEDNLLPGHRAHRPSLQGSVFWMAPEVVKQTAYTRKADIWSVGCLVVEMLTGEHPWAQLTQMQAIFKIGSSAKPQIPADISPEAENFLQLTFELNHEARPSAAELLKHPWVSQSQ